MVEIQENTIRLTETIDKMLNLLDARSRDVITRRFGLKNEQKETLESIGREYGITRERVRQIEANAKKTLAGLESHYKLAQELFIEIFRSHGGVMAESHIVSVVQATSQGSLSHNHVVFFLTILPGFIGAPSTSVFAPHWRYEPVVDSTGEAIVHEAIAYLKEKKHPIPESDILLAMQSKFGTDTTISTSVIVAALTASQKVSATVFGEWGLTSWPETNPRGVGDKAYAVLRRQDNPAHFRDITQLINEAHFDHKKANPQTVHNELIKDSRFVLVGRGLYGLKEWGYISGTVADVLAAILERAEKPLTSDQLISKVLEQRIVKKNTILLSLQNGNRFQKTASGYTLRQG